MVAYLLAKQDVRVRFPPPAPLSMTFNLEKLIFKFNLIDEPNASACKRLLEDNLELFLKAPGSSHNHQAWPGGYLGHVYDTMHIGMELYFALSAMNRPLDFSYSDVLLVMFLHDLEKPWKYCDPSIDLSTKLQRKAFRAAKIAEYGITLTDAQQNALDYVEGEYEDYSSKKRVMGPLAALCHMADVASARIWHDFPKID